MAVERRYEIGIIASTDTDLLPAIEAVDRLRKAERIPRICVVSYTGIPKSLQLPDHGARQPFVMRIKRTEYVDVRDGTVYVDRRT